MADGDIRSPSTSACNRDVEALLRKLGAAGTALVCGEDFLTYQDHNQAGAVAELLSERFRASSAYTEEHAGSNVFYAPQTLSLRVQGPAGQVCDAATMAAITWLNTFINSTAAPTAAPAAPAATSTNLGRTTSPTAAPADRDPSDASSSDQDSDSTGWILPVIGTLALLAAASVAIVAARRSGQKHADRTTSAATIWGTSGGTAGGTAGGSAAMTPNPMYVAVAPATAAMKPNSVYVGAALANADGGGTTAPPGNFEIVAGRATPAVYGSVSNNRHGSSASAQIDPNADYAVLDRGNEPDTATYQVLQPASSNHRDSGLSATGSMYASLGPSDTVDYEPMGSPPAGYDGVPAPHRYEYDAAMYDTGPHTVSAYTAMTTPEGKLPDTDKEAGGDGNCDGSFHSAAQYDNSQHGAPVHDTVMYEDPDDDTMPGDSDQIYATVDNDYAEPSADNAHYAVPVPPKP